MPAFGGLLRDPIGSTKYWEIDRAVMRLIVLILTEIVNPKGVGPPARRLTPLGGQPPGVVDPPRFNPSRGLAPQETVTPLGVYPPAGLTPLCELLLHFFLLQFLYFLRVGVGSGRGWGWGGAAPQHQPPTNTIS